MAGARITLEDRGFQRRVAAIKNGVANATPLMKIWGAIGKRSVEKNFEVEGRPTRWKALSPATANRMKNKTRRRGFRRILFVTGHLKSITVKAESTRAILGSNPATKDYAAIHQFGGQAGRGRKVTIPRRSFLFLQPEDYTELHDSAKKYLVKIGT